MRKMFVAISLLFSLTLTSVNAVEVTQEAKITGLYVAFFNRAADQAGLDYWTTTADNVAKQGGDVSSVFKTLSKGFSTHPTFKSTYDHLSDEEFVAAIYRNSLGKDGDAEGIAYWTDLVERVMSRSDMVATFVELSMVTDLTKENYPNLSDDELAAAQLRQDLITNKVTVALAFTHQLGTLSNVVDSDDPENDLAYLASIKIISEVTEDVETVSSVLTFLKGIKESSDQVEDILGAGQIHTRVLAEATKVFNITETDLSDSDVAELSIEGISQDNDGNMGTMGGLTDVIATKTITTTDSSGNEISEKKIVFRSFNVVEWKGKLNEETTLLSRIFMDVRLSSMPESLQASIARKLLLEKENEVKNTLVYQKMAIDSPFVNAYYVELIEDLREIALDDVPENTMDLNQSGNLKVVSPLSTSISSLSPSYKIYTVDENIVGMGLLQVKNTDEALEFANYAKVNYGIRAYEIDGSKQEFEYSLWDINANMLNPGKGGAVGGLYDYWRNKIQFMSEGNEVKYDDLTADNIFYEISKLKLEMYKWQGGYPTLLNTSDGLQIVVSMLGVKGNISDTLKRKLISAKENYEALKDFALKVDTAISAIDMMIDGYEWIAQQRAKEGDEAKVFSDDFMKLRKDAQDLQELVQTVLGEVDDILNAKGYDKVKTKDWDEIINYVGVSEYFDILPRYKHNDQDNGFSKNMSELITNDGNVKRVRLLASFNAHIVQPAIESIIDEMKAKDNTVLSDIDLFNNKYGEYFSFKQMHYVTSYIVAGSNLTGGQTKDSILEAYLHLPTQGENFNLLSKAKAEYAKIMTSFLISSNSDNAGHVSITGIFKAKMQSTAEIRKSLDLVKDLFSGAANIGKKDKAALFKASTDFIVSALDDSFQTIGSDILKTAAVSLMGGGYAKVAFAANDITSYVAGNFLTPNKQYLELNKVGDTISIRRPPISLVGIDSENIARYSGWDNIINHEAIERSYLLAVDANDYVTYKPVFNIFVSQVAKKDFKELLNSASFPNNTFVEFDFNIEKSDSGDIIGNFERFGSVNNQNSNVKISPQNMTEVYVAKGENDIYYFDIFKAWDKQQGSTTATLVNNKTRGLFRDFIDVEFFQPTDAEFPLGVKQQSVANYMYKAQTGVSLGSNIQIDTFDKSGNEWVRIVNNNTFAVYFEVAYDSKVGLLSDDRETVGDYYVGAGEVFTLPSFYQFLDDKGEHNNVEFIFYDEIAQNFFANTHFSEPRLKHYLDKYNTYGRIDNGVKKLTHTVKLEDIQSKEYLVVMNQDREMNEDGEIRIHFNMPVLLESLSSINVEDVYNPKTPQTLASTEYMMTMENNTLVIKVLNPVLYHEYAVIIPSTLTSQDGKPITEERRISFDYNTPKRITLELLNPEVCKTTHECEFKVGKSLDWDDKSYTIAFGDGESYTSKNDGTADDTSSSASGETRYFTPAHIYSTAGNYNVVVTVEGESVSESLYVVVEDTVSSDITPPGITILGANPVNVTLGNDYSDVGATAMDDVDGSIDVMVTQDVDTSTLGSYTVTYTASDSAGNEATSTRTVHIVDAETIDLAAGLVAHYEFEDNANDSSDINNADTNVVEYTTGIIGKSIVTNGIDSTISINNFDLDGNTITFSTWINLNTIKSENPIIDKHDAYLIRYKDNGQIGFYIRELSGTTTLWADINISSNDWYHIIAKYDGAIKSIYINGKLIAQQNTTGNLPNSSYPMYAMSDETAVHWYSDGQMDDLRIYNRALNETEIQELYEMGTVAYENTTFSYMDDFDTINKDFWYIVRVGGDWKSNVLDYNSVLLENGEITLQMDRTDDGSVMYSKPLRINKGDIVTIKRKAYVHAANRYFSGGLTISSSDNSFSIDINETLCSISHLDYNYNGDWNTFVLQDRKKPENFITPIWNDWFEEELVYNTATGKATYKVGNETVTETCKVLNTDYIKLRIHPFGWYTGHYTKMDYINIDIKSQEVVYNNGTITHNGITYGTVTSPHTEKVWLDRNIGASQVCTSFDDSACYGDYYQWGRGSDGHEKYNSVTTSIQSEDVNNAGDSFIIADETYNYDWAKNADIDGSLRRLNWSKIDGTSVCPIGYRVPMIDELKNETINYISNNTDIFDSFLKVPSAGSRYGYNGLNSNIGVFSSIITNSDDGSYPYHLDVWDTGIYYDIAPRSAGYNIRCVKN